MQPGWSMDSRALFYWSSYPLLFLCKFVRASIAMAVLLILAVPLCYGEERYVVTSTRLNFRECPSADTCSVIRTLDANTQLQVLGEQGEWINVRDILGGDSGWIHSSYVTAVAPLVSEAQTPFAEMGPLQTSLLLLLLISPLLLGTSIGLLKPSSAVSKMDTFNLWLLQRKERASSSDGFFAKYWSRPVLNISGALVRWTEKIEDPFKRCGTRLALYIYFLAIVVAVTAIVAYVAVLVVVGIVVLIVTFWILAKVLSSDDDDSETSDSYSSERRVRSSEERAESKKRDLLLRAGSQGSTIYQKTGLFSEDQHGRVDENGRIYKKTGLFSEEQVGRIDENGKVFTKTGLFSEEEAGRIDESGKVYEKSGLFSEEQVGRLDESGKLYRKTGLFSEEEIGRVDSRD